jgi:NagD protein
MIGDRMDTDIVAGIESGMETILVLSGLTREDQIGDYPFQPPHVYDSVASIPI